MNYIKQAFDVSTLEQAKHVVLSSDPQDPGKFNRETRFLVDAIQQQISLTADSVVLDFGCGMGRIAKEIINKYNSKVIGLDISPSMLQFAKAYTDNSEKFFGTHIYNESKSVDLAISSFALQHAENPKKELDNIISALKINGIFVLLNEHGRFIPSGVDQYGYVIWGDDGFDVFEYCESKLEKINEIQYLNGPLKIIFYRRRYE